MQQFLKLIRWPNLVIILMTMFFTLFFVINPLLGLKSFEAGLTVTGFVLLVLATLFIAIGGYLINDFFDMDIDRINKPGKNQVGKKFPVAYVQLSFWILNILAAVMGFIVAWMADKPLYGLVFVFTSGLLWFYSERYQCMPLVGNLVVAFLSTLSFALVWLFDFFTLVNDPDDFAAVQTSFPVVNKMMLIYMGFAFVTTLIRELVKDIEDVEGDDRYGCNTFPVRFGIKATKVVSVIVLLAGLALSAWAQLFFYYAGFRVLFFWFFLIDIEFFIVMALLMKATDKLHYSTISVFIKILMLTGILSMIFVYFET
ncbi:MAG: UbiA family prenyltransferase [Chlorobi bacterium]|nr:UbiA family prenyltransferase [Chlorobiota bacterium]